MALKKAEIESTRAAGSEQVGKQKGMSAKRQGRKEALKALATNPQFVNYKFWEKVDNNLFEKVAKAMVKAEKATEEGRKSDLKKKLAEIETRRSIFIQLVDAETVGKK